MCPLPKMFIGSSSESLEIAYAIQENLDDVADCTVWTQGVFSLSSGFLDQLVSQLGQVDFGIFVVSPDDQLVLREDQYSVARDNVIFEIGLFIGRLGIDRTFLVHSKSEPDLHIPTDLLGITTALYRDDRTDKNLNAALAPACNRIRKAIQNLGNLHREDSILHHLIGNQLVQQSAAVCYRVVDGRIEFLLIRTSGGRWVFPKGMIVGTTELWRIAAKEAYEEAGVSGYISKQPLTVFKHFKGTQRSGGQELNIVGFLLRVETELEPFELNRTPTWISPDKALEILAKGRNYVYYEEAKRVINLALSEIKDLQGA